MPGYLGTEKQFRSQFLKKIMKCRMPKASESDLSAGSAAISQLHKLVLPFVMRRLKTEVLKELPEKNVQDYECQLTEDQKDVYRFIVDRCTASYEEKQTKRAISSLLTLISLRKITDHTTLVFDLLTKIGAPQDILNKAFTAKSGKMEALKQLLIECEICKNPEEEVTGDIDDLGGLNEVGAGHRALIFCQWKASAKLVSNALSSGEFGSVVSHLVLDGSVPAGDRMKIVNRFNEDKTIDVLVLTTHIGGVGLNLTGADTVIFMDHDWNPMKDLQAIDRAHRLGQTRNVNVYRLITQGTIEEKVMSLAKFKLNTAQALIDADITSIVDRPDLLADHTMSSVEWEAVEVLMPRILRGKSKEDVKQLLLAEIDGMSKKRLMAVLAGETLEESSSSEEEEEEIVEEVVEEAIDEIKKTGEEQKQSSSSKETSEEASEKASEESDEKKEEPVREISPVPMEHRSEGENNDGEASEEGEIHDDESERSMTPPDPSPSIPARKSEEVDSDDDDFDRQLDRDLEDVI